jgi:hypothetical protein
LTRITINSATAAVSRSSTTLREDSHSVNQSFAPWIGKYLKGDMTVLSLIEMRIEGANQHQIKAVIKLYFSHRQSMLLFLINQGFDREYGSLPPPL